MRRAVDVHLQDLPRVTEQPVQVETADCDLVGSADEHHSSLEVDFASRQSTHGTTDLRGTDLEHPPLVCEIGRVSLAVVLSDKPVHRDGDIGRLVTVPGVRPCLTRCPAPRWARTASGRLKEV